MANRYAIINNKRQQQQQCFYGIDIDRCCYDWQTFELNGLDCYDNIQIRVTLMCDCCVTQVRLSDSGSIRLSYRIRIDANVYHTKLLLHILPLVICISQLYKKNYSNGGPYTTPLTKNGLLHFPTRV